MGAAALASLPSGAAGFVLIGMAGRELTERPREEVVIAPGTRVSFLRLTMLVRG